METSRSVQQSFFRTFDDVPAKTLQKPGQLGITVKFAKLGGDLQGLG